MLRQRRIQTKVQRSLRDRSHVIEASSKQWPLRFGLRNGNARITSSGFRPSSSQGPSAPRAHARPGFPAPRRRKMLNVQVARAGFGEFLCERIFAPLDMKSMAFHVPEAEFEKGSAGLASTADDFNAFAQVMLNGGRVAMTCLIISSRVSVPQNLIRPVDERRFDRPIRQIIRSTELK